MRIVFIGSSGFGKRCLELLLCMPEITVVGVVTAARDFTISYRPTGVTNVLHADVSVVAQINQLPCQTLQRSMNDQKLFKSVVAWQPDAFLVAGWYHMIPRKWRDLAPAYGLHASLLPDYSGGAPLVWAMINGETKTGITLFQMDDGVDSGLIAGQKEEPIYTDDTIATLYGRIEERGLELLGEVLPQLADGTLKLQAQDESRRRVVPQRTPQDGWIDWKQDAMNIDRFIRAQTRPYPGAFTSLNGKPLHVWSIAVHKSSYPTVATGEVICQENACYLVSCGKDAIELREISYEQQTYNQQQLPELFGGGGRCWATRRTA